MHEIWGAPLRLLLRIGTIGWKRVLKAVRNTELIDTLLIGGKGTIGAGLRTYLPQLDTEYRVVSADLPGAPDAATDASALHQPQCI